MNKGFDKTIYQVHVPWLTPIEKYLKAQEFLKEMASYLSTCGEKEFLFNLDQLKSLKEIWMKNEDVSIQTEEKIQTEKNLQTEDISNETEIFCQTEIIMNDTCEDHNNEKTEGQAIPTVEEASENRTESTHFFCPTWISTWERVLDKNG